MSEEMTPIRYAVRSTLGKPGIMQQVPGVRERGGKKEGVMMKNRRTRREEVEEESQNKIKYKYQMKNYEMNWRKG